MPEPPHRRGQALVEFAVAVPILILLVAGVLELGRGYAYSLAVSDAARDGARYVAGKTAISNGPGLPGPPPLATQGMCNLIKADLAATTGNVICPVVVGRSAFPPALPWTSPADFPRPAGGQAVVAVFCGTSIDCRGATNRFYKTKVDVVVYFGFNDLNLFGGAIVLSGSGRETTSW